ncbi:MAG: TauD/TfdA family dioxygenase [Myxococcales bacterium]|nr:TauD/TfdA family dioxygenase [Myxococcales bacterium]
MSAPSPAVVAHEPGRFGDSLSEICDAVAALRGELDEALVAFGVVVFSGFPLRTAAQFGRFARAVCPDLAPYVGGQTDRTQRADGVYEATRVPGARPIPLHSEMAYAAQFPARGMFHCEARRCLGGASWFAHNREIWSSLPTDLRHRLERHGVRYTRLLPHAGDGAFRALGPLGTSVLRSWQDSFGARTQQQVEKVLRERGIAHAWTASGWLDLSATLPAERDGGWFNQLHTMHVTAQVHGAVAAAAYRALVRWLGFAPLDAQLGDGSPFTRGDVQAVVAALRRARWQVELRPGEVAYFDNVGVSHGRARFAGVRRMNAAFFGMRHA